MRSWKEKEKENAQRSYTIPLVLAAVTLVGIFFVVRDAAEAGDEDAPAGSERRVVQPNAPIAQGAAAAVRRPEIVADGSTVVAKARRPSLGAPVVGLAASRAALRQWPPAVCQDGGEQGGLAVVCGTSGSSAEKYELEAFWDDGLQMLGEDGFVAFLRETVVFPGVIAGTPVQIWGHSVDKIGHRGALTQQEKDTYNLAALCKDLKDGDWIADFGGNLGITAIHLKLRCPGCKVVTVEPSPWNFIVLRLNLLQNADVSKDVAALQAGLAPETGTVSGTHFFGNAWVSRLEDIFTGSFIKAAPSEWASRSSTKMGRFEAPLITMGGVMEEFGIDEWGLLKLDCEGCEWAVIMKAQQDGLWKKVRSHFGELHPLCSGQETDIVKCLPRGVSIQGASSIWMQLCGGSTFVYDMGCEEPKFGRLSTEVAAVLRRRLCGTKKAQEMKAGQREAVDWLCDSKQ